MEGKASVMSRHADTTSLAQSHEESVSPVGRGSCLLLFFTAGVDILVLPDRDLQVTSDVKVESLRSR